MYHERELSISVLSTKRKGGGGGGILFVFSCPTQPSSKFFLSLLFRLLWHHLVHLLVLPGSRNASTSSEHLRRGTRVYSDRHRRQRRQKGEIQGLLVATSLPPRCGMPVMRVVFLGIPVGSFWAVGGGHRGSATEFRDFNSLLRRLPNTC